MRNKYLFGWLLVLVFLVACSESEPEIAATNTPTVVETEVVATPTETSSAEKPTATPNPTNTPQPTAEPTPSPEVDATEQRVDDDGVVVVDRVFVEDDSWVALFAGDQLLATTAVEAGETDRLLLTVDPLKIGDELTARLYEGGATFSAENPLLVDGDPVETSFPIDLQITLPQVQAFDQVVTEAGVVSVRNVVTLKDGWLAVYNDDGGALQDMVGIRWLAAGKLDEVDIPILWRQAWPTLRIVLHEDAGEAGLFDRGTDPIVRVDGEPIAAAIVATYPIDIAIINQPVVSGTVVVDRVISSGPGWLTISYETEEGEAGNVIGFAPLVDGLNENITVEVIPTSTTETLYARLHKDTGVAGEFDYPNEDPIALYEEEVIVFPFSTNSGNYLTTKNQEIDYSNGSAYVTVPLIVSELNAFAVVRVDADGAPGEVIGNTWVPAGVTRDVRIEIDAEAATDTLFVVLHIDRGALKVFEFPDGQDFELQRRRAPISSPFTVLK